MFSRKKQILRPLGGDLVLRGQLGVIGWREASAQVLEDVQGQTAHQRDDGHFPQERYGGDEINIDELVQEDERGDIRRQAQELGNYHEPVPCLNGQGHHQ